MAQLLGRRLAALLDRVDPRGARPSSRGRPSRGPRPSRRSSGRASRARRPPPPRCRRRVTCGSPCARRPERRRRGSSAVSPPNRWLARSRPSKGTGSFARNASARGNARRRPDPLPAGRVRLERAPAARRARRPGRAAGRRPDAGDGAGVARRAERGKESVVCDLPADASPRPGTARPGGHGARVVPARRRDPPRGRARTRARTGGLLLDHRLRRRRAPRAARGHDLNYVGWAGVLDDTAPALPPVQVADLAAGALGAVTEILAALLSVSARARAHTSSSR